MKNGSPKVKKASVSAKIKMKINIHEDVRSMKEAFYRKVNPRREQEVMDARMIQEDHAQIANLSERFINRQWDPDRFCQSLGRFDELSEVGE
jgi:hypothetical protein